MHNNSAARRVRVTANAKLVWAESLFEWHCTKCRKLLGLVRNGRVHISFARGHEYLASPPITAVCRGCGILNELGR